MERNSNRLAELRTSGDLARVDIAAMCGVSENTVRRWELGENAIPDSQKRVLCERFDCSVEDLLGWDEIEAAA